MTYDTNQMITNGKLAKQLGINPKTLRKWAKQGIVPSFIHPGSGYRYYFKSEVIKIFKRMTAESKKRIDQSHARK